MNTQKLKLLIIALINVSEAANFLEKLFKNHINDARCFSRCRSVVSEDEREECINFCQMLIKNPEVDICALTSICTGGCRKACADSDHHDKTPTTMPLAAAAKIGPIEFQNQQALPIRSLAFSSVDGRQHPVSGSTPTTFASVSLTNCRLSWSLETASTNVVFLVSGKDKAGKWNLIRNMVEDNTLELDTITVAKMEVIQIFAVEPQKVADVASFDISNSICRKPETILNQGSYSKEAEIQLSWTKELKEENDKEEINMELIIKRGTSITATIVLTLLAVLAIIFGIALIYVKINQQKQSNNNKKNVPENLYNELEDNKYETVPELPYSVPSIIPSIDDLLFNSSSILISDGELKVEKLLKPTIIALNESNEYEEVGSPINLSV